MRRCITWLLVIALTVCVLGLLSAQMSLSTCESSLIKLKARIDHCWVMTEVADRVRTVGNVKYDYSNTRVLVSNAIESDADLAMEMALRMRKKKQGLIGNGEWDLGYSFSRAQIVFPFVAVMSFESFCLSSSTCEAGKMYFLVFFGKIAGTWGRGTYRGSPSALFATKE